MARVRSWWDGACSSTDLTSWWKTPLISEMCRIAFLHMSSPWYSSCWPWGWGQEHCYEAVRSKVELVVIFLLLEQISLSLQASRSPNCIKAVLALARYHEGSCDGSPFAVALHLSCCRFTEWAVQPTGKRHHGKSNPRDLPLFSPGIFLCRCFSSLFSMACLCLDLGYTGPKLDRRPSPSLHSSCVSGCFLEEARIAIMQQSSDLTSLLLWPSAHFFAMCFL